jgi:hypothetical protein
MKKYYLYLFLLFTISIFTGCSNKINFNNYEVQNYIEKSDIKYKKPFKLSLEQILFQSLSNNINNIDFKNITNYNNFLHVNFNTLEKNPNIKLELILESLDVRYEYIPSRSYEYKGKIKQTEPYYNVISYARIASKLTNGKNVKILRSETTYSQHLELSHYYNPQYTFYGYDKNYTQYYQDVIDNTLTKIFRKIQRELMTPFLITKVLKEIKKEDKNKPFKIGLQLNGGTCDGLFSGQIVVIYSNVNNHLTKIGKGEVTSDSSCHRAWVKVNSYIKEPKSFDLVY